MKKNILFVDDDRILRNLIKRKFQAHSEVFTTLIAADGVEALQILKENHVSIIVTDLQMPNMDGHVLLANFFEKYPDIPVIILTAYGTTQSQKRVMTAGATAYIEKPFVVEDLADMILNSLAKEAEGGTLKTISMEMYIQLIEMEQKTCTVRVLNKITEKQGVLFFKAGDLMDARLYHLRGNAAAYEIIGWDSVTISIQDECVITQKKIEGGLQAILFDAMRLKDEATSTPEELEEGLPTSKMMA